MAYHGRRSRRARASNDFQSAAPRNVHRGSVDGRGGFGLPHHRDLDALGLALGDRMRTLSHSDPKLLGTLAGFPIRDVPRGSETVVELLAVLAVPEEIAARAVGLDLKHEIRREPMVPEPRDGGDLLLCEGAATHDGQLRLRRPDKSSL